MTATLPDSALPADAWLPTYCPQWCCRDHAAVLAESGGDWVDAQKHTRDGGADILQEICNPVDHRVVRPGGGSYDLQAEVMGYKNGGFKTLEVIALTVDDDDAARDAVTLPLTSGEARTLARQLLQLADLLDLPDLTR